MGDKKKKEKETGTRPCPKVHYRVIALIVNIALLNMGQMRVTHECAMIRRNVARFGHVTSRTLYPGNVIFN